VTEEPFAFDCAGERLVGVLAMPDGGQASRAVIIVVGGPQYRSGSHRQFTLLARALARRGIPALRFDYRGMGDSGGELRTFEGIGDDIAAAIGALCARLPTLKGVVLWGLCDAASAIMFYAGRDPRVAAIVVLNPWVYTPASEATTRLRYYYLRRLKSPAFWTGLVRGRLRAVESARSLWPILKTLVAARLGPKTGSATGAPTSASGPLPERMAAGLARYRGPVLLILSGKDLVAREFTDYVAESRRWQALLASPHVTERELTDATHTFSTRASREQVETLTADWCDALPG
jgi:exosortase A-associated hydrolase 1